MPDYERELDKYEKSVEEHVKKVSQQLDEELVNINRKYKDKIELMKKMELDNKRIGEENERTRQKMEIKKKVS
ncbi:uncharacterized protein CELE_T05F1.15 [Caenorhabditis elegans]|uniref:Uncharacterized protein n=1 Tax=Caenorhabditis elegans TaxID=6239 RepID=C6KRN7_CAEEL|nr:Uncharacterized protein CELE_T05F1.15 [Caenorhabditis elegans]CAZ65520.1 Uncharacterized protein CELE_T05F1.15 [Caenorhabditis elegans]|eukprot:NP_001251167.1 Uncharacterized protein CELE_T05F1.15 [Caenorhabditis elegans]